MGMAPSTNGIWCTHSSGGNPLRSLYVHANTFLYSVNILIVVAFKTGFQSSPTSIFYDSASSPKFMVYTKVPHISLVSLH